MTHESDAQAKEVSFVESPPHSIGGILQRLGPGLIIAGSIVGSGELIATTKTGAEAGFLLLWLIVIGCVIKVFVQVEMGRYTITSGKTALAMLAEMPGRRVLRGNWLQWWWLLMFLASIGQLGGIIGGVGQALQISFPLTENGKLFNEQVDAETQYQVAKARLGLAEEKAAAGDAAAAAQVNGIRNNVEGLGPWIVDDRLRFAQQTAADPPSSVYAQALALVEERARQYPNQPDRVFDGQGAGLTNASKELRGLVQSIGRRTTKDDELWALVIGVVTSVVLLWGRYGLIQTFATVMVASFTLITIVNVFLLQSNPYWAITWPELTEGLSFKLPRAERAGTAPIVTALATFGIIGVGANELISYPYWCLEKGYARFTGPQQNDEAWAQRARGWLRVMRWDAWCSMVVYTFATIAFYMLGAAVLGRTGLNPAGGNMIRTLGVMYEPVFGHIASWVFLFGAFAVLYSTLFVASASHARVFPDALRTFGLGPTTEESYRKWIRMFSGIFPMVCVLVYWVWPRPAVLILVAGSMQGIMLPMLAAVALYFRYKRIDARITPGRVWDFLLWASSLGMLITGTWTLWKLILAIIEAVLTYL
jgi:Mn2+/Fe2+ NRAMP family transporter